MTEANGASSVTDADAIAELNRSRREATGRQHSPAARIKRAIGWAVLFAVLLAPAGIFGSYTLYVTTLAIVSAIAVVGLNLILGYAGQISLAQAAFMGIGAYTVALTQDTLTFWGSLLLAIVIGFVVGLALGVPSLRVRHHYLAFVTLAFQIGFELLVLNETEITGGALGLSGIQRPTLGPISFAGEKSFHVLTVCLFMAILLLSYGILNSQWGRAFKAIRENEVRAATLGVSIRNYKLLAFAIGSAMAAVAGALIAPLLGYIDPTPFFFFVSLRFLLMVVIGGSGRLEGPLIGAFVVLGLPEVLRVSETFFLVMFSFLGILMVVFMPKGLVTLIDLLFTKVFRRPAPRLSK